MMEESKVITALAALAQVQRLRAFRALVVAGPQGLTPTVIAEQLGIAPNALSFHLKELVHANLVNSEPRGRHLIYRANFQSMNGLLGYMTEQCCQGAAALQGTAQDIPLPNAACCPPTPESKEMKC